METARRVLDFAGGPLVTPMTVLVEQYWHEIRDGLAEYATPVRHFVLHADRETLERRIANDAVMQPSKFRRVYLDAYARAIASWLPHEAEIIDTTGRTPAAAAEEIARSTGG